MQCLYIFMLIIALAVPCVAYIHIQYMSTSLVLAPVRIG